MTLKRTVLIADDDPEMVRALAIHCQKLGLSVDTAENGIAAVLKAKRSPPNLMITDISMPEVDGFKVCERLRELHIEFPVIALTGLSNVETIDRCNALGTHYVLKDNHMWDNLEPLISRFLQTCTPAEAGDEPMTGSRADKKASGSVPKVLAIDDDPGITKAIKIRLRYHGVETLEATDGMQGFQIALKDTPDVIITDYNMPVGSGDYLLARLKQSQITQTIPVIVLTGQTGKNYALQRDLRGRGGVSAYLTKPLNFDQLLAELQRHITLDEIATRGAYPL